MANKRLFVLSHQEARRRAVNAVQTSPEGYVVSVQPPTRTLEQSAAMWAALDDISRQVVWHGQKLDSESWKHIFSSALKKQEVVPNLDGTGFVVLGQSTSQMTKAELSDMLELIASFGAEHEVKFGN